MEYGECDHEYEYTIWFAIFIFRFFFVLFCFFVFLFFCFFVSPLVRCILSIPFSHGFVFMIRGFMEIGRPRYERHDDENGKWNGMDMYRTQQREDT